jgi:hypothetical protein
MTKAKASNALKQLIDTNKVQLTVQEWVERGGADNDDEAKGDTKTEGN